MEYFDTLVLNDKTTCAIVDTIEINNNKYLYLVNVDDTDDFFIRKEIDPETVIGLDSEEEFDMAMVAFAKKHNIPAN